MNSPQSNQTESSGQDTALNRAEYALSIISVIFILLGVGSRITIFDLWENLKQPSSFIITWVVTFVVNPFIAFGLCRALDVDPAIAIGAMAVACCPCSSLTNLLMHLTDGDLSLSISLTITSVVLSVGVIPLVLFISTTAWKKLSAGDDDDLLSMSIPYQEICVVVTTVLLSAATGILIRHVFSKQEERLIKFSRVMKVSALFAIVAVFGVAFALNSATVLASSWKVYVLAFSFPIVGHTTGLVAAWLFRHSFTRSRTIAIGAGIQDTAIAIAIVSASFKGEVLEKALSIPELYGLAIVIAFLAYLATYHTHKSCSKEEISELEALAEPENELNSKLENSKLCDRKNKTEYTSIDNSNFTD